MLLLLAASPVSAEEPSWLLAAELFSTDGISGQYEAYSRTLPLLVLSEISRTASRIIPPDERKARELRVLSAARVKLVRERADLVLSRDRILLSADPGLSKKRKTGEAEIKIRDKEKEIAAASASMQKLLAEKSAPYPGAAPGNTARLDVWKSGSELFVRPPATDLAAALDTNKISALLTGSIEDIGGYLLVTVSLETGIAGIPPASVSDAGTYEGIGPLAAALAARLLPEVAKREPVRLFLSVEPESARVFIDGRLHEDNALPATVFSGAHTISATAPGYITAVRNSVFTDARQFAVTVTLEKESEVSVAFDTGAAGADLFMHTRYFGTTPLTVTIPALPAAGELLADGVHTFFVFDPDRIAGEGENRLTVRPNRVDTKERIEKARSALYWSLGALYISLPFSMLTYGIGVNKFQAYEDGKLDETDAVVNEINAWARTARTARYISIGLGCNVVYRLVRYLFAAEQATPQIAVRTQ